MADINLNFGTDDLNELRKLLDEYIKIASKINGIISRGEIVSEDEQLRMKLIASETLKISNELEKQQRTKSKLEQQDQRATQKAREQSGIIGSLEQQVKQYTTAWKSANTEMEKRAAKKNLDEIKKKLQEAKDTTDGWGKALGSFQFKFNALGNIAANVLSGMTRQLTSVVKEFISFEKILNSTQTTGDKYAIVLASMKGGFEALNKAIATGNWENFFKNFRDAAIAGKQFAEALDDIGDAERSVQLSNAQLRSDIEELRVKMKEESKFTIQERMEFAQEVLRMSKEMADNEKIIAEAKYKSLAKYTTNFTQLSIEEQEKFLRNYKDNAEFNALAMERINLEFSEREKKAMKIEQDRTGSVSRGYRERMAAIEEFDNKVAGLSGFPEYLELYRKAQLLSDDQRAQLVPALEAVINVNSDYNRSIRRITSEYETFVRQLKTVKTEVQGVAEIVKQEIDVFDFSDEISDALSHLADEGTGFDRMTKKYKELIRYRKATADVKKKIAADEKEQSEQEERQTKLAIEGENALRNSMIETGAVFGDAIIAQFKNEKTAAIARAVMDQALAITNVWSVWAKNPAIAIPLTALAVAQTAAQIATIKAQKFEKGGEIGGRLHSQGGTMIEAEKGEFVVNRSAYSKNKELVQAINENDSLRIAEMMSRDRKIIISKQEDYTKKLYDLLSSQEHGYETNDFYIVQKGNMKFKIRKN